MRTVPSGPARGEHRSDDAVATGAHDAVGAVGAVGAESDSEDARSVRPKPAEPEAIAARYGRTPRNRRRDRWLLIVGGAIVAVVIGAWVIWAGLDGQRPAMQIANTGHQLLEDERAVEVSWNLSVPAGNATACVVQAMNEDFTVVGWKVVEIPASDRYTRSFTERIRVAQPANTGVVEQCWLT